VRGNVAASRFGKHLDTDLVSAVEHFYSGRAADRLRTTCLRGRLVCRCVLLRILGHDIDGDGHAVVATADDDTLNRADVIVVSAPRQRNVVG